MKQPDLEISINKTFFEKLRGIRQARLQVTKGPYVQGQAYAVSLGTGPLGSPVASPGGRGMQSQPCPVGRALEVRPPVARSGLGSLLPTSSSKTKVLPQTGVRPYQNLVYGRILIENHFLISPFQT